MGSLKTPIVVSIDIKRDFASDGNNIRIPKMEVLFRSATSNLEKSKKLHDWTSRNAILLLTFLIDTVVADR